MKKLDLLVLIIMLLMVSVKLGELTEEINELKKHENPKYHDTYKPTHV
jgi:hypothetical protein